MKIKYVLIFVILLVLGNFARLFVEDKTMKDVEINEEVSYDKNEAKKESDLSKTKEKFDINLISYEELLKLGFNKSKATKIIEYIYEVVVIENILDLKNVNKFGESGLKQVKKYLIVDNEKIKDPEKNYGKVIKKFNINNLDEDGLKKIGFTKKEIKILIIEINKNKIRSNVELEKIIGKERYIQLEKRIKFID